MAQDPVRLLDFDTPRNGKRYSDADKEAAYVLWQSLPDRSLRKAADALGISNSTLAGWSRELKWAERAKQEDAEQRKSVRAALARTLLTETDKALARIIEMSDDAAAPYNVRLAANQWLAGVGGLVPIHRSEAKVLFEDADEATERPIYTVEQLSAMSADELAALQVGALPLHGDQADDDQDDDQTDDPEAGLA